MPVFARPIVQLGTAAGIIVAVYCAAAAAIGCFGSRSGAPGLPPIVEEMPPAEPTMTALPTECAALPVLAGVVADKGAGTSTQHGAAGQRVPVWVQASSFISTGRGASSLFDPDPESYWHIDIRKTLPVEWAVFDFGADAAVDGLLVKPRLDAPSQLFSAACLLGGNDRASSHGIARLSTAPATGSNWIGWTFGARYDFRYYWLAIPNESHTFYSIGKLEFVEAKT